MSQYSPTRQRDDFLGVPTFAVGGYSYSPCMLLLGVTLPAFFLGLPTGRPFLPASGPFLDPFGRPLLRFSGCGTCSGGAFGARASIVLRWEVLDPGGQTPADASVDSWHDARAGASPVCAGRCLVLFVLPSIFVSFRTPLGLLFDHHSYSSTAAFTTPTSQRRHLYGAYGASALIPSYKYRCQWATLMSAKRFGRFH